MDDLREEQHELDALARDAEDERREDEETREPLIHYEGFGTPGVPMCGSEVLGFYAPHLPVSCVVCADLWGLP